MKAYMLVEYSRADRDSYTYGKVYLTQEAAHKARARHEALEDAEYYFYTVREVQICGNPKALVVYPKKQEREDLSDKMHDTPLTS